MSIGLTLGLVAALCWGLVDVSAAYGGRRLGSIHVAAIVQLTSLIAVLALCVARTTGLPATPADTLVAIVSGMIAAAAYIAFFTALRIGPVSVVSPVVAAYGGLTVVRAVLIRGETLTPVQAAGAAVGTAGVILTGLIFDGGWRGTRIVGRGVLFSIVALICFAGLTIVMAGPIRTSGWLPVLLAARTANAATVWIILAFVLGRRPGAAAPLLAHAADRRPISLRTGIAVVMIGGILDIIGLVAFAIGLEQAPTWIVGLASSFGPVVTVLVAVLLWGERLRATQWLGLVGIGAGLVAVALP
jgi:drug/metabolite transporter (DMT)-like permease